MKLVKPDVLKVSRKSVLESSIKTKIFLFCEMKKINDRSYSSRNSDIPIMEIISESTDASEVYNNMTDKISENMVIFNVRGSNCIFRSVVKMNINLEKCQRIRRQP